MLVQSTDKTEATDEINYIADSKAGTVSATTQKVLTDDSSHQSADAGDSADLVLTDPEQASFLAACDTALASILAARSAVALTSTDSLPAVTATDATAKNGDASAPQS
jgi:hypothetical protein